MYSQNGWINDSLTKTWGKSCMGMGRVQHWQGATGGVSTMVKWRPSPRTGIPTRPCVCIISGSSVNHVIPGHPKMFEISDIGDNYGMSMAS